MPTQTQTLTAGQRAVADASALTAEIADLEREHKRTIERLKKRRRLQWLKANRAGVTYDALVAASGVSDGYLCRQVAIAKTETRSATLAARPGRSNGA